MSNIPDFTEAELRLVSQTLLERYGQAVDVSCGEADIRLGGGDNLAACPVLHWEGRGANFVVFKIGANRFRTQFYYTDVEQFGTGREIFDNLGDCVITVLQVQSDDERNRAGIKSGMNAFSIGKPEDYDGPIVI